MFTSKAETLMVNRKYSTESVRDMLQTQGYELLSEYEKSSKQILVQCPKGHTYLVYICNFNRGHRCGHCERNKKFSYSFVKEFVESKGYTLLSESYSNAHELLNICCPSGHRYMVSFNSFKRGTRCSQCSASKGEHLVREILKYLLVDTNFSEQYKIVTEDKKFYYDFCIETTAGKKIFIEYDGVQHFKPRELFGGDVGLKLIQERDREKEVLIKDQGHILIRVPYYLEDAEVFNLLKYKLKSYVAVTNKENFKLAEYNPKGYNYVEIAKYFKDHTQVETAEKFGVSSSFPSSCFIKVYGKSKTEYLKGRSR
ncbi:homing endonuclease [Bacillus phage Bobb]|uniref:Homing endonuclease n=1 Tax=Bacillus phage Bobb TaxID=1527469 RepID=A0A076G7W1_9CAUD|nr:homing endonuclease [Bacillus phage Bobb]AII28059.1 hypothetical protein [Bacillus phage Bobb]